MQASDPLDPRAGLGAVKAQPGNAGASRKPSATAGLDRPCARRDRRSAGRDEGGLSANQNAGALISMMARSKCSNQRPDTLMHDRLPPDRRKPLATRGRTIHSGQTEKNSV